MCYFLMGHVLFEMMTMPLTLTLRKFNFKGILGILLCIFLKFLKSSSHLSSINLVFKDSVVILLRN